jgi:hypothetical protein
MLDPPPTTKRRTLIKSLVLLILRVDDHNLEVLDSLCSTHICFSFNKNRKRMLPEKECYQGMPEEAFSFGS